MLEDGAESEIGTNPLDPDTDGGGVDDATELDEGTDPLDPKDDPRDLLDEELADALDTGIRTPSAPSGEQALEDVILGEGCACSQATLSPGSFLPMLLLLLARRRGAGDASV